MTFQSGVAIAAFLLIAAVIGHRIYLELLWRYHMRREQKLLEELYLQLMRLEAPHKHKCWNRTCGFVWEHTTLEGLEKKAHDCPRCGKEQRYKYFGTEPPGQLA